MDEAVDPKARVAAFLDRFEDLVHSSARSADHWDDELA